MQRVISLILTISFWANVCSGQSTSKPKDEYFDKSTVIASCPDRVDAEFVPGQIMVQFAHESSEHDKQAFAEAFSLTLLKSMDGRMGLQNESVQRLGDLALYKITDNRPFTLESLQKLTRAAEQHPGVRFAEPNWIYRTKAKTSDDDYYNRGMLWGVYSDDIPHPIGPSGTTSNYGTQVEKAWANDHVGSADVYVAVVDSGIQVDHPDLKGNVDVNDGWDFYYNHKPIFDFAEFIHGTHVAGIIGARGGNRIGVAGMVWNVQLISAKFIGPDGLGNASDAVDAFNFITALKLSGNKQVVVINNSWSGYGFSRPLLRAIKAAAEAG